MTPEPSPSDHVDHLLAQWADERPEFDTSALSVAARVARLERFLHRTSRSALDGFGLNEGEGNVLAALRRAGPPFALTPTELYRSLLLSSGAMTNRIDRLEEAGYVVRDRDPDDRRRVLVRLTDAGRELIDDAMDAHVDALSDVLTSALDDTERAELVGLLRKALVHFEDEPSA
jgi:DNA-binding MarR family transcriptional regulator